MTIRPLAANDWANLEALFGQRGACGGCWCMYWHATGGEAAWNVDKGERNREKLRDMVEADRCPAVLAFDGDTPVAWCRAGPRASFAKLQRSRKLWRDEGMADWSIVCFFVAPAYRGRGLAAELVRHAAKLAFASGAASIEAYPSVPKQQVMPAAFAWTGVPAVFEAAGFTAIGHDAGARRIYRLDRPVAPGD